MTLHQRQFQLGSHLHLRPRVLWLVLHKRWLIPQMLKITHFNRDVDIYIRSILLMLRYSGRSTDGEIDSVRLVGPIAPATNF